MPLTDEEMARGYETEDANARRILWFGGGLIALLLFAGGIGLWLDRSLSETARRTFPPAWPVASRRLPPSPRLELDNSALLDQIRSRDAALLQSYGWVDRDRGVVRIPVERALELVVRDGLPKFSGAAAPSR